MEQQIKSSGHREEASREDGVVVHALTEKDAATVAALRSMFEPHRGQLQGTAAREPFDAIMEHVAPAEGVTYEAGSVGGVPGLWCRPPRAREGQLLLHLHGGWFNWGSARAYRHLVGQIAARAGAAAFVPDYRLAPEHPFPAAVVDAQAAFQGLIEQGARSVALVGDSAGGALGLVLLALATRGGRVPVGAVLLSPVTDLTLSGESWDANATTDVFFTRAQAAALVEAYLGDSAATDPKASPLFGDFRGLPAIRVHVGGDEMLLDDSRRCVARAVAAGVDAQLHVWQGMQHVFQSTGTLGAAAESLDAIGMFLAERLAGG
jgi:epsilon-lactone hydrolase